MRDYQSREKHQTFIVRGVYRILYTHAREKIQISYFAETVVITRPNAFAIASALSIVGT